MSVHCSTLRLRDGLGWERHVFDVIPICVCFFTFFLSSTDPPVIAKMLGKGFGIQALELVVASILCGVRLYC